MRARKRDVLVEEGCCRYERVKRRAESRVVVEE